VSKTAFCDVALFGNLFMKRESLGKVPMFCSKKPLVSHETEYSFIRSLLEVDPNLRLPMTDSLNHPWLREHTPFHPPDFDEELMGRSDSAMSMSVNYQAFADLEGEDVFGMVANVVRQSPASPSRGQNKRMRAELSTLPEDSLEDVYNAADAARQNTAPPDPSPSVDTSLPDEHEGRRSGRRVKAAQRG